jgi:deoxyguanosine kinase
MNSNSKEKNQYIVIEGNIGAGKTSFATRLANDLNARLILEQYADNPFLPKFYDNPDRYSFPLELSFLAARYKQLAGELSQTNLFNPVTVADYYFVKSLIFARNTLPDDEFTLYRQLFDIIWQQLPKPSMYFYLHSPVERLLQNIKMRGREYEQNIKAEYLTKIT